VESLHDPVAAGDLSQQKNTFQACKACLAKYFHLIIPLDCAKADSVWQYC